MTEQDDRPVFGSVEIVSGEYLKMRWGRLSGQLMTETPFGELTAFEDEVGKAYVITNGGLMGFPDLGTLDAFVYDNVKQKSRDMYEQLKPYLEKCLCV